MGRLREFIGTITYNSGSQTINMESSSIKVGGRILYSPLTQVSVPLGSLTGFGRYFVYAVRVNNILALTVSINPPSVGPVGFSAYRLVKAFRANESGSFGVFYSSLSGRPKTVDSLNFTTNVTSTGTTPTLGTSGSTFNRFEEDGRKMIYKFTHYQAVAGTQGSGIYEYNLPFGNVDISKNVVSPSSFIGGTLGRGIVAINGNSAHHCHCVVNTQSTTDRIVLVQMTGSPATKHGQFHGFGNPQLDVSFRAVFGNTSLSDTPLEEL